MANHNQTARSIGLYVLIVGDAVRTLPQLEQLAPASRAGTSVTINLENAVSG